jgi:hypothetical protein
MPTEIPVRRPQIHMSTLRLHHICLDGRKEYVESVSMGTGAKIANYAIRRVSVRSRK